MSKNKLNQYLLFLVVIILIAGTIGCSDSDSYTIGAYYYPWYGPGRRHWEDGYVDTPVLGEYDSSNPEVIIQHVQWASSYGIDFFAVSWWGPDSREDLVLQNVLSADVPESHFKFVIVYESAGRLNEAGGVISLDAPDNLRILERDVEYIRDTYFGSPHYLRINNRPVIILYLSRIFSGNVAEALRSVRDICREGGYDVFIIGDEVFWNTWQPFSKNKVALFDAVTAYNMHASVNDIAHNFNNKMLNEYSNWVLNLQETNTSFIPGVIPGFDDTKVRPEAHHPIIERSENLFIEQMEIALRFVDPNLNMILITSWNEWHEGTTIEPANEYGLNYLEVIKSVLSYYSDQQISSADDTSILDSEQILNGQWQRIDLYEYGFSLSIPPEWETMDINTGEFDDMLVELYENNPSINDTYSLEFVLANLTEGLKLLAFDLSPNSISSGVVTNMNLYIQDLPFEIPIGLYETVSTWQLEQLYGEDLEIYTSSWQVGGYEGIRLVYEEELYDMFGQLQVFVYDQYAFLDGQTEYIISFTSSDTNYYEVQTVFENIVDSIEFNK